MVSARSVPRSTSPALVPGIVAARATPEPTTTIAHDAAATLLPLALFSSPPPPPAARAGAPRREGDPRAHPHHRQRRRSDLDPLGLLLLSHLRLLSARSSP